jgi:hypothetical protein
MITRTSFSLERTIKTTSISFNIKAQKAHRTIGRYPSQTAGYWIKSIHNLNTISMINRLIFIWSINSKIRIVFWIMIRRNGMRKGIVLQIKKQGLCNKRLAKNHSYLSMYWKISFNHLLEIRKSCKKLLSMAYIPKINIQSISHNQITTHMIPP